MQNFNMLDVHWKNLTFRGGGFTRNQYRGGMPKKRELRQLANLRGAWQEGRNCIFDGGVDTLMHTMKDLASSLQFHIILCSVTILGGFKCCLKVTPATKQQLLKMCHLRQKLRTFLICRKVIIRSQYIQFFVILIIPWFTRSVTSLWVLVHETRYIFKYIFWTTTH